MKPLAYLFLLCFSFSAGFVNAEPTKAPFGTWPSPLTAQTAASSIGYPVLTVAAAGGRVTGSIIVPEQAGKGEIVEIRPGQAARPILPDGYSAISSVHEYGLGSIVSSDTATFFVNDDDQQIYVLSSGNVKPITKRDSGFRYGDCDFAVSINILICVAEDLEPTSSTKTGLARIDPDASAPATMVFQEPDFVSSPVISPDEKSLTWISWDDPDLPFLNTDLWRAPLDGEGAIGEIEKLDKDAVLSLVQPKWSPEGKLYVLSDRDGWINLYRWDADGFKQITTLQKDLAEPHWWWESSFAFRSENEAIATQFDGGYSRLVSIDLATGQTTDIDTPYATIRGVVADGTDIYFVGHSLTKLVELAHLDQSNTVTPLWSMGDVDVSQGFISRPERLSFPTADGSTAYGLFFPPQNPDFEGPAGQLPPVIVHVHGGPTAAAEPYLDYSLRHQYYTSRGFAVLSLHYRGSSGSGRDYLTALKGAWGVSEVQDAIHALDYLKKNALADTDRAFIQGGSAGGYTVLMALSRSDAFLAGSALYGLSDLEAFKLTSHRLEHYYMDWLIGPYPAEKALYHERSPIKFVDRIRAPLILFQGAKDQVVPTEQSVEIYSKLKALGKTVQYVEFPDEGHGFRKQENIQTQLEAELAFFLQSLELSDVGRQ